MTQLTLVAETRLLESKNESLYDYFSSYSQLFCFLVRRTIHHLRHSLNGEKESVYRTKLMEEQQITNRMAKAIIRTAKNLLKLITESAQYQYGNLYTRKSKLIKKITDCKKRLDKKPTQHMKIKLFYLQMKLNNVNQRIANGLKLHLTFGTKQYLKNNKTKFLAKRDNQMVYIGDKYETSGNQQFQIYYNAKRNRFDYKIRYDNKWVKTSKYFYGSFYLKNKNAKRLIRNILNNPKSNPLSYRVIKLCKYLYLQIMYRMDTIDVSRDTHGVLGVDFNKGFISVSEIDQNGKLLGLKRYAYLHDGTSNQTSESMLQTIRKLVQQAVTVGKDIVIEDLTSLDKNKKQDKTRSKSYNKMINTLKFGRFKKYVKQQTAKHGITVHTVDPYLTSQIGKQKYGFSRKLNIHDAASYVIARRHFALD